MRVRILAVLGFAALVAVLPPHAPANAPHPRPTHAAHQTPLPPPVIYHGQASPLCDALARHIKPVIGMMMENDRTIAHSPPLFHRYDQDLANVNQSGSDADSSTAERDLTLYHLEQLVGPLANNVLAMQRELEDPSVFPPNPQTDDQRRLDALRNELLKALATQAVSLDLINGYVQTQQLAQMQHEGLSGGNINAITQHDTTYSPNPATPDPLIAGHDQAGLSPNPYEIDPLSIPGIAGSVGNTPLSRLMAALQWVRQQTNERENIASHSIVEAANSCARRAATPSPHPR
jgi:hypothetical protein